MKPPALTSTGAANSVNIQSGNARATIAAMNSGLKPELSEKVRVG
jgi:hypothetical protein